MWAMKKHSKKITNEQRQQNLKIGLKIEFTMKNIKMGNPEPKVKESRSSCGGYINGTLPA